MCQPNMPQNTTSGIDVDHGSFAVQLHQPNSIIANLHLLLDPRMSTTLYVDLSLFRQCLENCLVEALKADP